MATCYISDAVLGSNNKVINAIICSPCSHVVHRYGAGVETQILKDPINTIQTVIVNGKEKNRLL